MENTELMKNILETLHGIDVMMLEQGKAIKRIETKVDNLETKVDNLETKLEETKEDLKKDIRRLDSKIDIYVEELINQKADIKELKNRTA